MLKWLLKPFQKKQKARKNNYYSKCNELPIHNFNEVASNNDFSYLIKNKDEAVSDDVLQLAWLDILDEYLTISKNAIALNALKKKAKIMLLEDKLRLLEVMKYCDDRGINIDAELAQCRIKKDKIQVNIGMIKNDINRLISSIPNEEEKKGSNDNFENSIALLLEKGYNVNRHKMVVTEWVAALGRIEKQYEANKQ